MAISYQSKFCKDGNPFGGIERSRRTAEIKKPDGTVVFRQENVEAPNFWSDRALRTAAQKYFVRPGVSATHPQGETSVFDMCENVARTIADAAWNQGYFELTDDCERFRDDLLWLLIYQYGAFNSPVWFNCRRFHAYGIKGKGGNWRWDALGGACVQTKNAYENPQCSACFLVPVENSIVDGEFCIAEHWKTEARVFKYGSGSGTNFSAVQEKGSRTDSNGEASGLLSFLRPSDAVASVIKSGGTTRRAAKLICVDIDHPDIEDFIDLKMHEEKKALVLAAAGYGTDMESESYQTVTGQNANNSVRIPDAFFELLEADGEWSLTSRVDGKVVKSVRAKDLFHRIATAAWNCADPGLHYDSEQQRWHTCKASGPIRESNPCSEYLFLSNTACNLASLRLTAFLSREGHFDVDAFVNAVRVFIIAQDVLVDFSSYPTRAIAANSHTFRTLGLGYMDLGSLLMMKGLPYDSDDGRSLAAAITSLMGGAAYRVSAELSQRMGPFDGYEKNAQSMYGVMCRHSAANAEARANATGAFEYIFERATDAWDAVVTAGHGFRNAQTTLLAPTGTIGFLADSETTGVEPCLGLILYKQLAGGGTVILANRLVGEAVRRLEYRAEHLGEIMVYLEKNGTLAGAPHLRAEHVAIFDCAFPPPGREGPYIRPEAHVLMMAAVQPFLSGAISKTVNMPASSTVEDIENIYKLGWKSRLKALAVYRDGSKGAQPVTTGPKRAADPYASLRELPLAGRIKALAEAGVLPEGFGSRKRLPKKRRGTTQSFTLDGQDVYFRSGEYLDSTLGEVFIDVKNDGSTVSGLAGALARSISLGLQHGTPLKEYADLLLFSRFEPHGMVEGHPEIKSAQSIVDLLMRWLLVEYDATNAGPLKSVKTEADAASTAVFNGDGPPCILCGTITKRNGACYRCPNCSETSGCS